ncbi:NAD(P)H-dependent glycerol-3-phosphate dehydrogenase [Ramlibacter sp.]|uniref:NAD(P)H-dependent glycerol-3-phosphate dehydrogenase n=1 Tax=Ramlibacter sp. TaxID=1917967 RepID=UPI0017EC080E|nr:NAD(P)H-dependent glycerol-3-phosphate dehydrogenase [Ramlibacter sp.]MBA2672874.1 NAD(P)-dependent glycerol-3-phosphate dehydrogenase [Ramlibacter sp.]
MNILMLGAGAWGTALAVSAADRHAVRLWARDAGQARAMNAARENRRYLPGVALPPALSVCSGAGGELPALAAMHDLLVIATPLAGLRPMLECLAGCGRPVAWLCKGMEESGGHDSGWLGHEIQAQAAPRLDSGALSGPSFAQEVAQGLPTALVAASRSTAVRELLVAAFHGSSMRIYANDDLAGVEVGGAVKNVLAIATGLCDGLGLGMNARAALITRGLAEMTRLGVALGARAETFTGLSGLGDLVLTATGDLSRNRRVGLLLAEGRSLADAVESLGHVAEGVHCARAIVQRAGRLGVDMPIARSVVELLDGRGRPREIVAALMRREAKEEV